MRPSRISWIQSQASAMTGLCITKERNTLSTFDMPEPSLPPLLIVADSPEALTDLCGISLLERMRRVVLHLGFRRAMILSNSVKAIATHVAKQSWHRSDLSLTFRERRGAKVAVGEIVDSLAAMKVRSDGRIIIVFASFYCDGRLLCSLAQARINSALIDSDPPSIIAPLLEGSDARGRLFCATMLSSEWFSRKNRAAALVQELELDMMAGRIASVDAAQQQTYVESMRRNIRPVLFPAPSPECRSPGGTFAARRDTERCPRFSGAGARTD